jgi:hypothetical protein
MGRAVMMPMMAGMKHFLVEPPEMSITQGSLVNHRPFAGNLFVAKTDFHMKDGQMQDSCMKNIPPMAPMVQNLFKQPGFVSLGRVIHSDHMWTSLACYTNKEQVCVCVCACVCVCV